MYLVWAGGASWYGYTIRFLIPSLTGNIGGGVMLVAVISHAQVLAGRNRNWHATENLKHKPENA
jgi:formate-nitrite transporter family protein